MKTKIIDEEEYNEIIQRARKEIIEKIRKIFCCCIDDKYYGMKLPCYYCSQLNELKEKKQHD